MESFRAYLLQFFTKKYLNLAFAWRAWNSSLNPSILGNFFRFSNFLWSVLELIFCNFLPKNDIIWLLGGRLGTPHKIRAFLEFFRNFLIFCGMFSSCFFSIFLQKTTKFGYWADRWELAIKSKHLRKSLQLF